MKATITAAQHNEWDQPENQSLAELSEIQKITSAPAKRHKCTAVPCAENR